MALVTVITPTYNRGDKLVNLFNSLKNQTCMDFEWLIVDDGSTDTTKESVESFARSAKFPVHYLHKENGGKHTALNMGISTISTELTFIVDSDDTVLSNGIEIIALYYQKYRNEPDVGVFSFLRCNIKQGIILKMPEDEYIGSYIKERIKDDRPGDMAEVFYTKALKEFPFPVFYGEKFLSEDVVWIPLGAKYKTVFVNKPIYLFEYLDDGLTNNDKRHKFASPLGSMLRGKMLMTYDCGWKARIKGAIIYGCYSLGRTGEKHQILKIKVRDLFLVWFLLPVSILFRARWKCY